MHAVMEKDIAKKGERIVDGDAYKFFIIPCGDFMATMGKEMYRELISYNDH